MNSLPFSGVVAIDSAVDYLSSLFHVVFQILKLKIILYTWFRYIDRFIIIYLMCAQQHRQVLLVLAQPIDDNYNMVQIDNIQGPWNRRMDQARTKASD